MPDITVTVPNAAVPELVAAAEELLTARNIDMTGMTNLQKGKRYLAEVLKDVVIARRRSAAVTSVQSTINTAVTTATSDASGIS